MEHHSPGIKTEIVYMYHSFLIHSSADGHLGYYSAIKKNTFESVLMRWMKLEPIIQSEVSQKDKYFYKQKIPEGVHYHQTCLR